MCFSVRAHGSELGREHSQPVMDAGLIGDLPADSCADSTCCCHIFEIAQSQDTQLIESSEPGSCMEMTIMCNSGDAV